MANCAENAGTCYQFRVSPGGNLAGEWQVPGDKSISHRALILGALAEGRTLVSDLLEGEDTLATLHVLQAMGVKAERISGDRLEIHGVGLSGLTPPKGPLDFGNSGTSMRLLAGVLAAQSFASTLTGDTALLKRPMGRIVDPLRLMGAKIAMQGDGYPPLTITGGQTLRGIQYKLPMASAQVKSCLLLAGLYAQGKTTITEPAVTRDHTEKMLQGFGYPLQRRGATVQITGGARLRGFELTVPGDISSAAFFMVGTLIARDSSLILKGVGLNPSRIGIIRILSMMGAQIRLENECTLGAEVVADIHLRSMPLHGIDIPRECVSTAIDEFPAIFIAAACARGRTVLRGAQELRVKESDRIVTMAEGLQTLGIRVHTSPDGISIEGGQIGGGQIDSQGDHRVAMAFAMAGLAATDEILVDHCANVGTSFPGFVAFAQKAGLQITEASHDK